MSQRQGSKHVEYSVVSIRRPSGFGPKPDLTVSHRFTAHFSQWFDRALPPLPPCHIYSSDQIAGH